MTSDGSNAECGCVSIVRSARELRILFAENRKLLRDALRPELLKLAEDVRIFECDSFKKTVQIAEKTERLSLAILAHRMHGANGIEDVRSFRSRFPNVSLVVLSGCYDIKDILDVFDCGAAGFVSMQASLDSIINALRLVLSGEHYFPSEVLYSLRNTVGIPPQGRHHIPYKPSNLTTRETDVLKQLLQGHSNKVIARNLGVQEVTVKLHVGNLLRKLGATNRTQAVKIALQLGWSME